MTSPEPRQDASLLLDDQLCFALYAASRAVVSRYRPLLDELGLTYPQYLVMLVLWERDEGSGPVSVRELGDQLRLDSSTLSPLLKRLEAHGLVRRRRDPADERSVRITLTDAGRRMRERARAVPVAMGNAMDLTPEQYATAKKLLNLLTANVGAA